MIVFINYESANGVLTISRLVKACLNVARYLLMPKNCLKLHQVAEKFNFEELKLKTVACFRENPLVLESVFTM